MDNANPAYTIYQQALVFWYAYERCMMYIGGIGQIILPIPAMVNAAFSTELFLKAILDENGIPFNRREGHTLEHLFHLLPTDQQEAIIKDVSYADFDSNLSCCSKVFNEFRYLHEDIFKSSGIDLKFWQAFTDAVKKHAENNVRNKGTPMTIEF